MWKVERTCSFGFIGEDEFNSFDSAKIEFRHIIKNKHKDNIEDFTKLIDDYCERYYKDNIPKELVALKDMPADEQIVARHNLLKYCELDTYAMVKIWQKLKELCE